MLPAAATDGRDVQHGQLHRPVPQPAVQGQAGLPVLHQGYVGAGAAHVEGYAVGDPGRLGNLQT